MAIGRDGTKARPARVARTYRGICGICYQPVIAGQAYEYKGGTNTKNQCLVHSNCYKPAGAPTWEDLKKRNTDLALEARKG